MRSLDPKIVDGKMGFVGCTPGHVYRMGSPKVPTSASGTSLTLSSAAAPLTALTLYGKSEQRTTTGAQLIQSENPIQNNDIIVGDLAAGTYTLSFLSNDDWWTENNNKNALFVDNGDNDITFLMKNTIVGERCYGTFSTEESISGVIIHTYSAETVRTISEIMLNSGTTALPWEPYTGGAPSPSPDYPQEIKSVGESGTINVSLSDGGNQSQTLPVQTPNGLPGIPVSSGGNYTDANGQQWVCDEVDFKRGVYVQRVGKYIPTGNESISVPSTRDGVDEYFIPFESGADQNSMNWGISNKFKCKNRFEANTFTVSSNNIYIRFAEDTQTPESAREVLNGCEFWYILATSIETPLSASELAAYAALRTYSPTTVVSNDAGAWMKVGYYSYGAIERLVRWAESAERK